MPTVSSRSSSRSSSRFSSRLWPLPFATIVAASAIAASASCKHDPALADDPPDACAVLFGTPNEQTGLGTDRCRPTCACASPPIAPPAYDDAFVRALVDDWQLDAPYPPLTADPYAAPPPAADPPDTVCAVLAKSPRGATPRRYALVTYPSADAARAAGAAVTHFGRCGVCSTLANLAVYIRQTDLTAPVRACGLAPSGDAGDGDGDVACLQKLGFDLPCAQIWAYDTAHTRDVCLGVCLANLRRPYNEEDGAINPCLQCDEDQSGPVFKAVAGRTRRNSGLPNAICRPCSEVRPLTHDYASLP